MPESGGDRDLPRPCPSCRTPCHVVFQFTDGERLICPKGCHRNATEHDPDGKGDKGLRADGGTDINGSLRCRLFGHSLEKVAEVPSATRYECRRCPHIKVEERYRDTENQHDDLRPDGGVEEGDGFREWDSRIRSERSQVVFRRASETWGGYEGQVEKAIEEFEELIDALEDDLEGEPDNRETLKEIVDARVMLGQLVLYRTGPALEEAVDERMDRLESMIEDASHLRPDGGHEGSGRFREETVTICFLTNHEVLVDEVDLRYRDPKKIRKQLVRAAEPSGRIQDMAATSDEAMERYREEIREVKHGR